MARSPEAHTNGGFRAGRSCRALGRNSTRRGLMDTSQLPQKGVPDRCQTSSSGFMQALDTRPQIINRELHAETHTWSRRRRALGVRYPKNRVRAVSGGLAEWSNAPDLKSGVLQGTGGSNPSPSVRFDGPASVSGRLSVVLACAARAPGYNAPALLNAGEMAEWSIALAC